MGDPAVVPSTWHIVSCEYPPQVGGVSDHTSALAAALAAAGDEVHVWAPRGPTDPAEASGVELHRDAGQFGLADLLRVDRGLGPGAASRRLFVQWVPHGYGWRSLNVPFCLWVLLRSWRGDVVHLMIHEPFLAFGEGTWRQDLAAAVHRTMMTILLMASRRVWVSTPSWVPSVAPLVIGRRTLTWLPLGTSVPVCCDAARVDETGARVRVGAGHIVGHVGTYGTPVMAMLQRVVPTLLDEQGLVVLLMGQGSETARGLLVRDLPALAGRILATGPLAPDALSCHVSACDVMLQPFPDGVSYRRTSVMLALAHGRAVVTTCGHLTEPGWSTSGAVSLVPTGDATGQANAVIALLRDPLLRRRTEAAARTVFERQFDLSHAVRALRLVHEQ